MNATHIAYGLLAIALGIVAWQRYRYHKLQERLFTDQLSSEEREKEITALRKEVALHSTRLDEAKLEAKRRIADASDALQRLKGMYPNVRLQIAKGVFSHTEDAVWTGHTVTTVHFKGGAVCMLPVQWKRPKEIASGMPIILRFNFATSQVIVEPLVRKASADDRRRTNLRLVGSKKTEQED